MALNLTRTEVESLLEELRKKLAVVVGVTLVTDHEGRDGDLGSTYLTLRFKQRPFALVIVDTQIKRISVVEEGD